MKHELISDRSAWKSSMIGGKAGLTYRFTPEHLATLHSLMEATRDVPVQSITRSMFDDPVINPFLAEVADEMAHGHGAVILQGLSREAYCEDELTRIFWGIGTHLGVASSQHPNGDCIDHVRDRGGDNPDDRRQYDTRELVFHTDGVNGQNLGLLCLAKAKSGGLSRIASALTIHNEFAQNHPDLLDVLYEGYPYDRKNRRPGLDRISPYPVPTFSKIDGIVTVTYIRNYMEAAAKALGGMPDKLRAALDYFDEIANRDDLSVTFMLEPGEIEFINNRAMLHSRTNYEDHAEDEKKRHLVRLWIDVPNGRPYKKEMDYHERGHHYAKAVVAA